MDVVVITEVPVGNTYQSGAGSDPFSQCNANRLVYEGAEFRQEALQTDIPACDREGERSVDEHRTTMEELELCFTVGDR